MRSLAFFALCVLALSVCGCATTGVQQSPQRFYWPPLPDRPRIEWLGAYSSQLDMPKSLLSRLKIAAVGEDEPISLKKPLDVRADGQGRVYVVDSGASSVYVFDFPEMELRFLQVDKGKKKIQDLVALAVDDRQRVYVLDARAGEIDIFDSAGHSLGKISVGSQVRRGGGLAYDRQRQRILVTDVGDHAICAYSLDGAFLLRFGRIGGNDGEFNYPVAAAVDSQGRIIVADAMNARIQIFSSDGRFLSKFGNRGDGLGDFQQIKAVAVDSDDNIYVTDGRSHRVYIFSSSGQLLLSIGGFFSAAGARHAPGGFALPQGLDIDANDTIYVVDQLNRRFQVFRYLSEKKAWDRPLPVQ